MSQDAKNLILAFFLSAVVLLGWQYFYAGPKMERERQQQALTQAQASRQDVRNETAAPGAAPAATPANPGAPALQTREGALAASPRIVIETPSISGSIALRGARIDDVSLVKYRETVDPGSPHIVLLSPSGAPHAFYAETGFVGQNGEKVALPDANTLWTADGAKLTPETPVTLTWDNGAGLVFTRKISVDKDYLFTISDAVANKSASPVTLFPYALVSRHEKPATQGYAVLHEGLIGVVGDSGVQEWTYDKIEKEAGALKAYKGEGGWVGITDKYWAAVVAPEQNKPFEGRLSASPTHSYQADTFGAPQTVAPGATYANTNFVFAGAKVTQLLDHYAETPGLKKFDLLIDWGWFYFITRPMFRLIHGLYRLIGNFGLAILAVTVLVKLAFLPLANRSYLSMAKMQALQPQLKELQAKYGDDKVKLQQEQMELYKREKVNPVAGCLPMLIQIPVFFSLYKVLFVTIEMRQAPFYGWIKDLSAPDPTNVFNLFGLLPFDPTHVPVIGHFLWLGIWPLAMGISMWVQMKMSPQATDPVQRQMFSWMPVIFTFMMGSFPAGLVIYWTWNNLLSVLQQWWIASKAGVKFHLWDNLAESFGRKKA
ncbi:MAG: membrane protein insertase YidC [Hyphomicrobiales bacterium]|nr:membrane protein insertase YidC [Hyphomicrobiales bacterium]